MENEKHINLDYISNEIGIEKEVLLELLDVYRVETSGELLLAKEQLDKEDWTKLQRIVHNIKGVSSNLFISSMYEIAAAIDLKLKTGNLQNINGELDKLISTHSAVAAEIIDILDMKK